MSKKKLVLFPFNGNAIEAIDCVDFDEYEIVGFIDDDDKKKSDVYPLHTREILKHKEIFLLAVPGSPLSYKKRKDIIDSLNVAPARFVTIIHPTVALGKNVRIGYNSLIMAGVVLTSNVLINNHVCILPNSVIHHDSSVGNYTLIGSNVVIAGGTIIGDSCYVGSGSNIINGITVSDYSLIGLGSNVISNVEANSKVAGNPAKNISFK
jgi:sugar O-acyltransferase (sialic acid O-acetyltransferase NeuD family)